MLDDNELQWLVQQIVGTAELLGQQLTPTAAAMMAEDLSSYARPVLSAALSRVRTEHTGKLTTKAVIDRIDEVMGRPGANEAWATALMALDERNTVVWTEEMMRAWDTAQPLAAGGDLIGARMAFKDAYERLVRVAREERRTPVVTVSVGWDAEGRTSAIESAVKLGYIAPGDAAGYLPAPDAGAGAGVVAMLMHNGQIAGDVPPEVRARLLALRDDMATSTIRRNQEREEQAAFAAADLIARKAAAQGLADAFTDEAAELLKAEWAAVGVEE